MLLEGIRGVALFDERGRLVLSSGAGAGGLAPSRLREVLAGEAVSETAEAAGGGRTLRTYVPIVAGRSPSARGVAAFEQDYGPIAAAGRRSALIARRSSKGFSCSSSSCSRRCSSG